MIFSSTLSPYTTLADWINIHAQSGLRLKIPKPIYVQVFKDIISGVDMTTVWIKDLVMDTDEYNVRMKEKEIVDGGLNKTW